MAKRWWGVVFALFLLASTGTLFAERISLLILGSGFYNALPLVDAKFKERINALGFEVGQGVYH